MKMLIVPTPKDLTVALVNKVSMETAQSAKILMNVPWSSTLAVTPLTVIILVGLTSVLVNLDLLPMVHFVKTSMSVHRMPVDVILTLTVPIATGLILVLVAKDLLETEQVA